jgi:hypothetical protein
MTITTRPQRPAAKLALLAALGAVAALPTGTAGAATSSPAICAPAVDTGVLPSWARGGFSDAKPRIAHVTGRSGTIMGILFAQPLEAPPAKTHNNKILWVARVGTSTFTDLRIAAQRMVGSHTVGKPVARVVNGGPGPSIIDLPAAGCWRLDLKWAGHRDTLDVRYARNTG